MSTMSPRTSFTDHTEVSEPSKDSKMDDCIEVSSETPIMDEETNKRLLRKIDWLLMPVVSSFGVHHSN